MNETVSLILILKQNQIQKPKEPSCLEPILVCGREGMFWKRTGDKGYTVTPSAQSQTLHLFFFFIMLCGAIQAIRVARISEVPDTVTCGHNDH